MLRFVQLDSVSLVEFFYFFDLKRIATGLKSIKAKLRRDTTRRKDKRSQRKTRARPLARPRPPRERC